MSNNNSQPAVLVLWPDDPATTEEAFAGLTILAFPDAEDLITYGDANFGDRATIRSEVVMLGGVS